MRFSLGILASTMLLAGSVLAQAPGTGAQQKTPTQHQPGTTAPSANPPAGAPGQAPTLEKPDPAKEAAIRHLMEITQTSKLGDNISGAITQQVRTVMGRAIQPDQVQKFMDAFTQKFQTAAPSSAVIDAEIPIYAHYFSMEDIEGLIKFYESPLGQRVVKNLPEVVQNTQQTGVQMDQKAALDVLRGMVTEYPELKQMLPPEPGAGPAPGAGAGAGAPPQPPAPPSPQGAPPPK
jgi:uncharacterized protein